MLKNILNLEGAQQLTLAEQKTINGGLYKYCKSGSISCRSTSDCGGGNSTCIEGCCTLNDLP